jgi:hypothetical protein
MGEEKEEEWYCYNCKYNPIILYPGICFSQTFKLNILMNNGLCVSIETKVFF